MPDHQTSLFYQQQGQALFERYETVESKIKDYFEVSFPKGGKILDVGAGSGRDIRALLALGYDAHGIEPSNTLRINATQAHSELSDRIYEGALPNIPHQEQYDGILCSAVLMHLPKSELFDALINLRALLKPRARLLVSIPLKRPGLNEDHRDSDGRLFSELHPEYLSLLCARLGLELISSFQNSDSLERPDHEWTTLLFQKNSRSGHPLDRIESVLRNDNKFATYKLALLRAFCDLADRDDTSVSWRSDNTVAVPLISIAELWLLYYWPLLNTPVLIPQNKVEASGGKAIKFRRELNALIKAAHEHYQADSATLSIFYLNWKKGNLPKPMLSCIQN